MEEKTLDEIVSLYCHNLTKSKRGKTRYSLFFLTFSADQTTPYLLPTVGDGLRKDSSLPQLFDFCQLGDDILVLFSTQENPEDTARRIINQLKATYGISAYIRGVVQGETGGNYEASYVKGKLREAKRSLPMGLSLFEDEEKIKLFYI